LEPDGIVAFKFPEKSFELKLPLFKVINKFKGLETGLSVV
jgi:hypothetical protein